MTLLQKLIKPSLLIIGIAIFFCSCEETYTPKPRGYFRINLPDHSYNSFSPEICPFQFDFNKTSRITKDRTKASAPCWMNIYYPEHKSTIHLSYKEIDTTLSSYLEDARTLVYKHTVKASDIQERLIVNDSAKVYGMMYLLEGNAASPLQFYITDSTNHFLRGAMYFNVAPNPDSIAPVKDYIVEDMFNLIESFQWK